MKCIHKLLTFGLLWVSIILTLLSACTTRKEVSFQSGGVTHTFAEGRNATPDDFLLPVYPQATITGSVSAQSDADESSKFLMLSTKDSVDQVSNYYQNSLKQNGWSISHLQTLPQLVNIAACKEGLEASVMVSAAEQRTRISLSVNKETTNPARELRSHPDASYTPDQFNPPTD